MKILKLIAILQNIYEENGNVEVHPNEVNFYDKEMPDEDLFLDDIQSLIRDGF